MIPTLQELISAEFGFGEIKDLIFKIYTHPDIYYYVHKVLGIIDGLPTIVWLALFGGLAFVFTFFGKRWAVTPCAIAGTAFIGFLGGFLYIAPKLNYIIGDYIPISPKIVGLAFAAIAVVLFLPLYLGVIAAGSGYLAYLVVHMLPLPFVLTTTMALAAAAGVAALVLMFRKWFEMAGTALIGGYLSMLVINNFETLPTKINLLIWGAVAVVGFVVQVKYRRRY